LALAEKTLESDFFRSALLGIKEGCRQSNRDWRLGIYDAIRPWTQAQGKLSVERMCELARVSRSGYYRKLEESEPDEAEMALRTARQEIVLALHRRYGYRRVTAELHRRGMVVNHKRVLRLMRSDTCWRCGSASLS
jgi:HTH-like domain